MTRSKLLRRSERRRRRFQAEAAGTVQPPRPGQSEREYERANKGRHRQPEADRPKVGPFAGLIAFDEAAEWSEESRAGFEKYLREHDNRIRRSCFFSFDPAREDSRPEIFYEVERTDWSHSPTGPAEDIRALYDHWLDSGPPTYLRRLMYEYFGEILGLKLDPDDTADPEGGGEGSGGGPGDTIQ